MVETKGLLWRAGLSAIAALMLTTSAYAQHPSKAALAVDAVVQNWHDINPGAIEPGTIEIAGPPAGDGTGVGTGTGDGTDPGAGDVTGDGTAPGAGDVCIFGVFDKFNILFFSIGGTGNRPKVLFWQINFIQCIDYILFCSNNTLHLALR